MIIYTNNIFAGPLLLAVWVIDIYLLLVSIRLIAAQIPSISESGFNRHLRQFTDPVVDMVTKKIAKHKDRAPPWLPWLIVLASGFLLRNILISMAI